MSQDDYNDLLHGAIDLATDLLSESTEFEPFALAMQAADGELFHIEPDESDEELDAEATVDSLRAGLRADLGRWRAVAFVADVTLEDEGGDTITPAIHLSMEHAAGEPVTCIVPYEIDEERVELGDLVMEPGERTLFPTAVEA